MKQLQVILMEVPTSSTKTTGIENNHKIRDHRVEVAWLSG